jgi:polysaccharide export outer membrane protein
VPQILSPRLAKLSCLVSILASIWAQMAYGQNRGQENAPTAPIRVEAPKAQPGQANTSAPVAVDPRTYVIGPEDVLFIRVWREMDFSGSYVVRPDGRISLPLIGEIQAAGLTPDRLGAQLTQALADYINKPDVTVTISQVNSKKYYITGQVFRSGEFPLITPTRIFDALNNGGGFRDFANKKKIIIVRGAQRLKFNYEDIIKGKNLEQNIFLENGDTIVVP